MPRAKRAVVADLTIIGEAARHIPDEIAATATEIPWALMRGMRNRIVHGYYQVDPVVVWDTCESDLKPPVEPLRALIRSDSESAGRA